MFLIDKEGVLSYLGQKNGRSSSIHEGEKLVGYFLSHRGLHNVLHNIQCICQTDGDGFRGVFHYVQSHARHSYG